MAMLTSGEYTLIKKNIVQEKSMLFVKLTDSAQRALDNYFRTADKCEAPVIEFIKDEGRILIPTSQKGVASDKLAQFKFNVISNVIMQGRQGRFECIQHKKGNKQLVKFGQLTHRLRIHANEDVYETTKNRMAAIELEQRKNCTVQLDWNSTHINRKRLDRIPKQPPKEEPQLKEKQQIKRNKSRNLTSPCNSDSGVSVSSNQSPNNNQHADKSPPSTYKRPGYFNGVDGFQTKRQRISRVVNSKPEDVTPKLKPSPFRVVKLDEKPVERHSPPKEIPSVVVTSPPAEPKMPPRFQSPSGIEPHPELKYQKPKYMKEYVTITSMEQRRKYKTDFNTIFREYQRLHEEVDSISNTFAQLGESLRQHEKGTPKYAKIEQEIVRQYYTFKKSKNFQGAKSRFEYLHEKLSHIKNLVHEYDEKMLK